MQEININEPTKSDKDNPPKTQAEQDYAEGQDLLKKGEEAMAANAFHNALIGFEQENNDNGIANASDKLGDICLNRGKYADALKHWEKTAEICTKAEDHVSLFSLLKKRAKLYHKWQKYDKAIELNLEMIDEYSRNNNPQGTVDTMETLSEIYQAVGEKEKAADCLRTAANIHKNFGHMNFYKRLLKKAEEVEA